MHLVLNLDVQKITLSTEFAPDVFDNRIGLEGKIKCVEHVIDLGGVSNLNEATGSLRLVNKDHADDLQYNPENCVGRLAVIEQYGEWSLTGMVAFSVDQHQEIWKRLENDRGLRFVKILIGDDKEGETPKSVTLNSKDRFDIEAVEIEFVYETGKI